MILKKVIKRLKHIKKSITRESKSKNEGKMDDLREELRSEGKKSANNVMC